VASSITAVTGRNALWSGMRQVLIGGVAAGLTFGIARLLGVIIAR
jgi:hypothetical protein